MILTPSVVSPSLIQLRLNRRSSLLPPVSKATQLIQGASN